MPFSLRKGPSGPAADVDVSISPLSRALYVDPNSTVDGTRDGSIAHPFLTLQAAFDSKFVAGTDLECTFIVVPCFNGSNNAGNLAIPGNGGFNVFVSIVGECGSDRSLETTGESTALGAIAVVGEVRIAADASNVAVSFEDVYLEATLVREGSESPGDGVRLSFSGCQTSAIDAPNTTLLFACTSVDGDVTAADVEAYDSTTNAPPPGNTWTADSFRLDGATNYQLRTNGATLVGDVTVMERQARATIGVVVPALGAAALGYVDVDVTGTELDGVVAGDPIVVNPTADLAGAGANGGSLASARVSAPNTVRLAFTGALAGGSSNFTFARI